MGPSTLRSELTDMLLRADRFLQRTPDAEEHKKVLTYALCNPRHATDIKSIIAKYSVTSLKEILTELRDIELTRLLVKPQTAIMGR